MSARVRFALLAVGVIFVAAVFTLIESTSRSTPPADGNSERTLSPLDLEPTAAGRDLPGVTAWLNGDPIASLNDLRGTVVLVDFWTYTCVNCIRTLPFLRAWHEEYADQGLVIIGVHSPEFTFEKSLDNVRAAVEDLQIPWLVANDPDRTTWDAFRARAWPTKVLLGFDGRERKRVVGEGQYEEMEDFIRLALVESGADIPQTELTARNPDLDAYASVTREIFGGWQWEAFTPQRYLGNPADEFDAPHEFTDPGPPRPNGVYFLKGAWIWEREAAVHASATSSHTDYITVAYNGRTANAVLEPRGDGPPLRVLVTQDGAPLPEAVRGPDVIADAGQTFLIVDQPRLYEIVAGETAGRHELLLSPLTDRFAFHTFTFGP